MTSETKPKLTPEEQTARAAEIIKKFSGKPEASYSGKNVHSIEERLKQHREKAERPKAARLDPKDQEEFKALGLDEAEAPGDDDLPKAEYQSCRATREALIAKVNKTHALIQNIGGKTLIASWERSPHNPKHEVVVFQTVASFRLRYSNEFVPPLKRKAKPKKLGDFWVDHPRRRQYRGVVFKPSGQAVIDDCVNLWRGWGVEPKKGDWSLMRRHIEEVIADGDPRSAEYIIRWIAWAIQHPDRQAEVALVLIGHKGAGKGTLIRCLQRIFGAHAFQVSSQEHIVGRFNAHQRDCVLFIADESFWAGDKRMIGALQRMITEPTLSIEQKGIDLVEVPNMLHIVMLAERGWVIPAGQRERRYAAYRASEARLGDRAYFEALHAHIENGGAAAMLFDLRMMDLGKWHPRQVYETAALTEQKQYSLAPFEEWYLNLLQTGQLPQAIAPRFDIALSRNLLDSARSFSARLRYQANDTTVGTFLHEMGCMKWTSGYFRGWIFPPLPEARAKWETQFGPWPWESVSAWGGTAPTAPFNLNQKI